MSPPRDKPAGPAPPDDAGALIEHVTRARDDRCREIVEEAAAEAGRLRRTGRRDARRRVHAAVVQIRADARRRLRSAGAAALTRLRQAEHRAATRALETAWPALADALAARWTDPAARRSWCRHALALAQDTLPPGTWRIEHPRGFEPAELAELIESVTRTRVDVEIRTRASEECAAGLRVSCGGAVLDATVKGLLARPDTVRAMLLSALDARGARPLAAEPDRGEPS